MEIKQRLELRKLLVPELKQSLKVLSLPLLDLKAFIEDELLNNPFLEEANPLPSQKASLRQDLELRMSLLSKKPSLQDVLLSQLDMLANTEEEHKIGEVIIGNINENGYLKANLDEMAQALNIPVDKVETVLKLIQQFEPSGVAARTIPECLTIQLELADEKDPLLKKIVECHLEEVAKKDYTHIAKALKEPRDKIESLIKKILRLDPKPGRNYSSEEIQHIFPDVIIDDKDEDLEITISNEDIPTLNINKDYQDILKNNNLNPQTKEFLKNKLHNALELLRAINKRKFTLRKIVEIIAQIQQDAIRTDLSSLKPLTFKDVAKKIDMHESTVCRAVMNKYVQLPCGIVALKDFFSSHIHDSNGQSISSSHIKGLIRELVEQEDKKHPLSDQDTSNILLKEKNLLVSRRTVAKYREELKILSTSFRREK